jgi:hypothetical protein
MSLPPTIVTAGDAGYARCLHQLLLSAERRALHTAHRFVAYDLGLTERWRKHLRHRFAWCELRRFAFEAYPPHVALAQRSYAWKPLAIREVARERGGLVVWLDSATILRTADLGPLWERVRRHKAYVLLGQTALEGRCDPLTLQALGVPERLRRKAERAAGVIGLDCEDQVVLRLLDEWCQQALAPALIAPRHPPLSLHRPEQALLSILLYRYEEAGELELTRDEIDVSSGSPVGWVSSRNKVAPGMPLWADPLVRLYYATYKSLDQLLWRVRRAFQ